MSTIKINGAQAPANLEAIMTAELKVKPGKKPKGYAGKEKGARRPGKVATTEAIVDDGDLPEFLDVWKNGTADQRGWKAPGAQEMAAEVARAAAAKSVGGTDEMKKALAEHKQEKARVRIEKLKAGKEGKTRAMPLSGKAALKAIGEGAPAPKKAPGATKAPPPKKTAQAARAAGANGGPRPGTKAALVGEMLRRPDGCTTEQVLAATGWPSVSMPAQARAAGVATLLKEKVGRVTIYRAGPE